MRQHSIFNDRFFEKHQLVLLFLLNLPLVGIVMRRALWIEDLIRPIVKITPSTYHVLIGWMRYKAVLYSNFQYAEALHYTLRWIWQAAHWWDAVIANPFHPQWNLGFDTYTSQPDGTGGKDTFIYQPAPTTPLGSATSLYIGEQNNGTGAINRTLLAFDFSSLAGALPSSMTLSLWSHNNLSSAAATFAAYRQKRNWVEAEATWNEYSTGNSWSTAGGFHTDDCEQSAHFSRSMSASEANGEKQWTLASPADDAALVRLKEMWNGTWPNYGWLFKATSELDNAYGYRSSDYATAGERPKMVIVYVTGTNYDQSVSGSITPAGTLIKKALKSLAGAATPAGALVKRTFKLFSGAITPAGALSKLILKGAFTGGLTPAGALVKNILKSLGGVITPIGSLLRDVMRVIRIRFASAPQSDILAGSAPEGKTRTAAAPESDTSVQE